MRKQFKEFYHEMLEQRKNQACNIAIKKEASGLAEEFIEFLFPHFSTKIYYEEEEIESKMLLLKRSLKMILKSMGRFPEEEIKEKAENFISKIPSIYHQLKKDSQAIYEGDPAAESVDEVILAYPGFTAITIYRMAHELYLAKIPILPRILTEHAHGRTGIDIHPGAVIGCPFVIDHGTGIVIGESAHIGNNVKIYQGVTLGALSVEKNLSKKKRHPTIEDNVIIYAQAVILGGNTVIGHDSIVGGNSWLTKSVPPNSVVYNKSQILVKNLITQEGDNIEI